MPYSLPLLIVGSLIASATALAAPDELQVYADDLNEPGELSLEVFSSYAFQRPRTPPDDGLKSAYHVLRVSPEVSWGLTERLQVAAQVFTSLEPGGRYNVDGLRAEFVYLTEHEAGDHWFWGVLGEIGRLPRYTSLSDLNTELKGIVGYHGERWLLAVNPVLGWSLAGPGRGESPQLALNYKLRRELDEAHELGIEHYTDLGTLKRVGNLGQESQQLFAYVGWKRKGWEITAAIGRAMTTVTDRWAARVVLSLPLDAR